MGPLISAQHLERVHGRVEEAKADGANVLVGGKPVKKRPGYLFQPTVIDQVNHSMAIMQEEIFGPVLATTSFHDDMQAIRLGNETRYGLTASIWTRDLSRAHKMAADIQAGLVWVNCHGIPDMALPCGGVKQSGWGRENGEEALLQFTETKSVAVKL